MLLRSRGPLQDTSSGRHEQKLPLEGHSTALVECIENGASCPFQDSTNKFRGVHCRLHCGRKLFRAHAAVGPFSVSTRYDANLTTIVRFRNVLFAMSRQVAVANSPEEVESSFKRAVIEIPRKHGLNAREDMGLCFTVSVAAKHWVGRPLHTPRFRVADIEDGLCAWRRLREARGLVYCGPSNRYTLRRRHSSDELRDAWIPLSKAYLDIWKDLGRKRARASNRILELRDRLCNTAKDSATPASAHDTTESNSNLTSPLPTSTDSVSAAGRNIHQEQGSDEAELHIRRVLVSWSGASTALSSCKRSSQLELKLRGALARDTTIQSSNKRMCKR